MPLLENKIGPFQFLGIRGPLAPLKEILSLDERPGVNGTEITREGEKGRPFTVRTWVDQASYQDARNTFLLYLFQIGRDPVQMIRGGENSFAEGYRVIVLDVREVFIGTIVPGPGGLNAPSAGYLECDWDLLAVPL